MKQQTAHRAFGAFLASSAMIFLLCVFHLACTPEEERQFADVSPALAPTTRAVERVQQTVDPIAQQGQQIAATVKAVSADAAGIGVPGASVVALIATAIGAVLGVYNERRTGTLPLKSAVTQIVQSFDAAFPVKTDPQKAALASAQDKATKQLVSQIKAG
jgi:hypothetical protein